MNTRRNSCFFGPPLSWNRSFDSIFQNAKTLHTIHHRFVCYYDHLLGDVTASLALQNAYLSKRVSLLEKQLSDSAKKATPKTCDGGIFNAKRTQDFLANVNNTFKDAVTSACAEFHNYSLTIVDLTAMNELIDEAPSICDPLWRLMLELRIPLSERSERGMGAHSSF